MPTHKTSDYKLSAVKYYLYRSKNQVKTCKIFGCSTRSLMRWVFVLSIKYVSTLFMFQTNYIVFKYLQVFDKFNIY